MRGAMENPMSSSVSSAFAEPKFAAESRNAESRRFAQDLQAPKRECAILTDERYHVGDRRDGDKIQKPLFPPVRYLDERGESSFFALAQCRANKLESDCGSAQTRERVRSKLWIQNGNGLRQLARDLVVVGDDNIYALLFCVRHCIDSGRADIDGDDELDLARSKRVDCFKMESVPLPVAVRQIDFNILISDLYEEIRQNRRPRNTIAIKIRIHGNSLTNFDRLEEPLDGNIHTPQQKRVVGVQVVVGAQKCRNIELRFDAPFREKGAHEFGYFHSRNCSTLPCRAILRPCPIAFSAK